MQKGRFTEDEARVISFCRVGDTRSEGGIEGKKQLRYTQEPGKNQ